MFKNGKTKRYRTIKNNGFAISSYESNEDDDMSSNCLSLGLIMKIKIS